MDRKEPKLPAVRSIAWLGLLGATGKSSLPPRLRLRSARTINLGAVLANGLNSAAIQPRKDIEVLAWRKDARYAGAKSLHDRREICAGSERDNQNLCWRINETDAVTLRQVGIGNTGGSGDKLRDSSAPLLRHGLRRRAPVERGAFWDFELTHARELGLTRTSSATAGGSECGMQWRRFHNLVRSIGTASGSLQRWVRPIAYAPAEADETVRISRGSRSCVSNHHEM
jgi:hypothetical protein